jgi:hypothetical protein
MGGWGWDEPSSWAALHASMLEPRTAAPKRFFYLAGLATRLPKRALRLAVQFGVDGRQEVIRREHVEPGGSLGVGAPAGAGACG